MNNSIFIVLLLVQFALIAISICANIGATRLLRKTREYIQFIPDSCDSPIDFVIGFSKRICSVCVYAHYKTKDGSDWYNLIKSFAYDPEDSEDMDFAYREASELIEHLS